VSVVAVEGVGHIICELFKGQVDVSKDFSVAIVGAAMQSSRIFLHEIYRRANGSMSQANQLKELLLCVF
jgi:hypothetical protein